MPTKTIRERLEARYIPEPNSGGWIWLGALTKSPRGAVHNRPKMSVGSRIITASRLAYQEFVGEIPAGLSVLHKCDTALCINPAHLYAGTQADNVRDMVVRGRIRGHGRGGSYNRGEGNGRAKLTAEQVKFARTSADSSGELARRFGVSYEAIKAIRNGRAWRSITTA